MQAKHTSYSVPATNPQGLSLIIFRGAESNSVIEKQKTANDGRSYVSRYIQLKFDIMAANGKGYIKTNVFINPKPDANSEDRLELLKHLGIDISFDSVELESNDADAELLGTEVSSYALTPGTADFTAVLNQELPELDDDSFAIEILDFCQRNNGAKYFCKLVAHKQQGDRREFTRYEITPDSVSLAAPPPSPAK